MTRISTVSVGGNMDTTNSARNRVGLASSASTSRIITESVMPPKYPATAPHSVPSTVASTAAASPTSSEICPPTMSLPRTS